MALHDRLQFRCPARKFPAKFRPGIAGLFRLAQANLKRDVAAKFGGIVIAPGNGIDANTDVQEWPPA
jgi:hypothetical protein